MIPVNATLEVTDSLPGEEVEATIGDARWVMRSMSDLYSNRELAVAREYSTNAIDEHIKFGVKRPIEVHLPVGLDPYFRVRDFGVGLSKDELKRIYVSFGDSTKRDSNDVNGVLGFGSKSALAYTDTFKVTTIKAGMKTTAIVTRREDWSIVLKVIAHRPTTEPSGTEVEVAVHNMSEFQRKARDFYRFWRPGTVLVNGVEPEHAVGEQLTDDLYYSEDHESYVVMGNVGYRIENPEALFRNRKMRSISFVAYVGNGTVEFTPSREALKYTDHTKDTLHKVVADFEAEMLSRGKAEIAAATTHWEAYEKWSKWTNALGRALFDDLSFKGDQLVDSFSIKGIRYRPDGYGYSTATMNSFPLDDIRNTLIITEYPFVLSSSHKSQAREYAKLKGQKYTYFLFSTDKVKSPWVSPSHIITWEDLKAALPPKPKKSRYGYAGNTRIKGTFDYWTESGFVVEKDIPDNSELFYITTPETKNYQVGEIISLLPGDKSKIVVVKLAVNRIAKFKRDNRQAHDFIKWAETHVVRDGGILVPERAKKVMGMSYEESSWLTTLTNVQIDDPRLAELREAKSHQSEDLANYRRNKSLAIALRMLYNGYKDYTPTSTKSFVDDYPLLENLGYNRSNHKHIAIYMNAVYQQKGK